MYTNDQVRMLGMLYRMLNDANGNSKDLVMAEMYPYKFFTLELTRTMKNRKLTNKMNKIIANALDDLDIDKIDESHPISLEQRGFWHIGYTMAYNILEDSKLKKKRLECGLTQSELANKIGVVQKDISRWENKLIKPSIDKVKLLAEAMSCTTDDLI